MISTDEDDFGGPELDADPEAERVRVHCRECMAPVALKRNGKPARLCADHLERDRKRKTAR